MKKVLPAQVPPIQLVQAVLSRALVLMAIWWVLSGGDVSSWAVGAVTVALALAASLKLIPAGTIRFSVSGGLGFLGFFLLQSLKGGFQVGMMALRPRLDLCPAEIELRLRLPPGGGQLFLASIVTMMPGTMSITVEHGQLRLHALDARWPIEHEVRAAEAWVARMFRQQLQ